MVWLSVEATIPMCTQHDLGTSVLFIGRTSQGAFGRKGFGIRRSRYCTIPSEAGRHGGVDDAGPIRKAGASFLNWSCVSGTGSPFGNSLT